VRTPSIPTRLPRVAVASLASLVSIAVAAASPNPEPAALDFHKGFRPALEKHCAACHGREKNKGGIDLHALQQPSEFLQNPRLLANLVEVLENAEMPPDSEPPLEPALRATLLATLRSLLTQSTANLPLPEDKIRRLNRFQYNNAVKDLFGIRRDIFALPEKLMTRHAAYLGSGNGALPPTVSVSCESFNENRGFRGIDPFPKDLRAAHGFDNQSNQLTLSPLLLDAYLKLGVSIVESPDFTPENVGLWNAFFAEPGAGADLRTEVSARLRPFLLLAFRGAPHEAAVLRYTGFAMDHMAKGASFTATMKKVASAVIASPLFLFQYLDRSSPQGQLALASKLSFTLWGSGPDRELLDLAAAGQLRDPETLQRTVTRMMQDGKIERFLDSFPAQWMQLENILGAAPDRQKHRFYSLDPAAPAAVQMVLEPLLLFDAVFLENRRAIEFIRPDFSYRSDFLEQWYGSGFHLNFDPGTVAESNHALDQERARWSQELDSLRVQREALLAEVRAKDLAAAPGDALPQQETGGLKAYAAWDFNGDLRDSIRGLNLEAHGVVEFREGAAVLDGAYLESKGLPVELREKTLEAWIRFSGPEDASGSVMSLSVDGKRFDAIALGSRPVGRWFSQSENLVRSLPSAGESEPTAAGWIQMVAAYGKDGTTTLYRNGVPYGPAYNKGFLIYPKDRASVLFGRSTPGDASGRLSGLQIDKARLYDRALTPQEVASAYAGSEAGEALARSIPQMSASQREKRAALDRVLSSVQHSLQKIPAFEDPGIARENAQRAHDARILALQRDRVFRRVPVTDPRYGGIITNAAVLTMTSGPKRTLPIARGSWVIEVVFNDPPPPPPNNVPPLSETEDDKKLTIREQFAKHRENPDCAICHARIDPLGFALENFDGNGRWRDRYENGRGVDPGGTLLRSAPFRDIVEFKGILVSEEKRFARAFASHLLRFALARELTPADGPSLDRILGNTAAAGFRTQDLVREVLFSESFLHAVAVPKKAP
jgi:hypothetical protein